MARAGLTFFALFTILIAVYFEFSLKARLSSLGVWRKVEPVGNQNCNKVETLQACEKIVLHPPSGLLYLACATPAKRRHWLPALEVLQEDKVAFDDYIATYDPATGAVTRLTFSGFPTSQGYSSHGLDIVPSAANPRELFVYAINHRKPVNGQGKLVGADSVVEIFKTTVGGNTLTHVRTIESPIIDTPNDVVGSSDGRSFYFTNDHGVKVGFTRLLEFLGLARTSVGYCHVDDGCKIAMAGLPGSNGIARAQNGTIYVANSKFGQIRVLEEQNGHSLVLTDIIALDRLVDNLSIDTNGALWAAGFPDGLAFISAYHNSEKVAPSSALRITKNTGNKAFFGEKLKVEKVFEDDGTLASAITSVVHDARRNLLFLSGVFSDHLTVCKVD
ncbi:hypothetical protein DFH94DRAFT_729488 [Russula ochroleuca]|jgi:hypothetical protein|uniref:Serum paraoxonase/arylesterase n=1 Tax=Russula ochroleuca TaxID=152965 RepID=A0A9P5MZQ1_9AGAM|nr:hypothetical protein DFH94DRAFT_729488 [Russula ochroleuca]